MKRADQLFVFEERVPGMPQVEKIWRTQGKPADSFISVAVSHWEMVVTSQNGKTYLTVRGPETRASTALIPDDAEYFGVQFRHGVFMPGLPSGQLVDGSITLPEAIGTSFWLNGSAWELPTYENADVFVDRLVREGLLVRDPVVESAVQDWETDLSVRSVQRRVLRATGLTLTAIRQIDRAQKAAELLDQGVPIADTVGLAGYADQAHLTRSLKRFVGQTPSQIVHREPTE